jgi:hypothetical protein
MRLYKNYGKENQRKQKKSSFKYLGKQANDNRMRQYGHILTKNEERIPKKGLKHVSKGTMPKGETENKMGKTGDKRHHTEGRKKVCDLYRSPSTVWIEKSI